MPSTAGSKQANREFRHQDAEPVPRGGRGARPAAGKDRAEGAEAPEQGRGKRGAGAGGLEGRGGGREAEGGGVRRPEHSRRDPAQRTTAKPGVNLRRTSETAPLRAAMDAISECFTYCLEEGHTEKEHLTCMLDAWDALNATASLVARGSRHADAFRSAAADVVKACEESCEEFGDDETMKACADVCREAYEHLAA